MEEIVKNVMRAYELGFAVANIDAPGKKMKKHEEPWFDEMVKALRFNNPEFTDNQILEITYANADKISNSGRNGKQHGLGMINKSYRGPSQEGMTIEVMEAVLKEEQEKRKPAPQEVATVTPECGSPEDDLVCALKKNGMSLSDGLRTLMKGITDRLVEQKKTEMEEKKRREEEIAEKARLAREKMMGAYDTGKIIDIIKTPVHRNGMIKIPALRKALIPLTMKMTVALWGPKGAGKTDALKNTAEDLGWDFDVITAPMFSTDLAGFIDVNGNCVNTTFTRAFQADKDHPILFTVEEIDRALPEALIAINSALANGIMSTPAGNIRRGEGFYIAFTANTNGKGGTAEYATANQLDGSTIDRAVWFYVGYDEEIIASIAGDNAELRAFAMDALNVITELNLEAAVSMTYRTVRDIVILESAYDDMKLFSNKNVLKMEVLNCTMVKGASEATLRSVYDKLANKENAYAKALDKMPKQLGKEGGF